MRLILPCLLSIFFGCNTNPASEGARKSKSATIRYATKFDLEGSKIEVFEPWPGAVKSISYQLDKAPSRIICTSTTHLPFLEQLGVENTLIGFPGTQYITSENIRTMIDEKKILDVGGDGKLNLEMIIGLNPDLVIAFDMGSESTVLDKLEESGITVIYNSDYLETHPLGRAEWIKFFGAIFQKQQLADSIFTGVAEKYNSLKELTDTIDYRPRVLSGVVYGDVWFLPGGKNWSAQFFEDAGGQYFLRDNQKTGWLELSFEYVFEQAQDCEFWIGVATFQSLEEMRNQDSRYTGLKAFREKNVFNHSKRIGEKGGYDIFESGYARPDMVLSDIIKILHPDLLPGYETYYYEPIP